MKRRIELALAAIGILLGLAACGPATSVQADVVVSFYPYEYLAKRICGDKLKVASIVPKGAEPHDFELKTSDVMALYDAKAIFLNGLNMENFVESVKEDVNLKDKTYVLSEALDNLIEVHGKTTYVDTHVWLDTDQYAKMGEAMLGKIVSISPENEAYFRRNLSLLEQDLNELEDYAGGRLVGKTIAVAHDAFRYMCRQFGFSEIYINGFSPDEEPTAEALQALLDAIKEKGIDTLFVEELGTRDIAEYIAEVTGVKIEVLSPLETIEDGEDFLSVYRGNIDKIAEAKSR